MRTVAPCCPPSNAGAGPAIQPTRRKCESTRQPSPDRVDLLVRWREIGDAAPLDELRRLLGMVGRRRRARVHRRTGSTVRPTVAPVVTWHASIQVHNGTVTARGLARSSERARARVEAEVRHDLASVASEDRDPCADLSAEVAADLAAGPFVDVWVVAPDAVSARLVWASVCGWEPAEADRRWLAAFPSTVAL